MCSAVTLPCASSPARQLALRHRVVAAVRHVLLARPDQLDRRAGHLLGDRHRLAHPVVHRAAPAEAAAESGSCRPRIARAAGPRLRRRRRAPPRRSASASRPRSARASSAPSRSSAPSSRGSGADTSRPPRSASRAAASAARASPSWLPTAASLGVEPAFSTAANLALLHAWRLGPWSHSIGSASSAVLACHQVSATTATAESPTRTTFFTPGASRDGRGVDALHLAAEHRAVLDRRVEHARAASGRCRRPARR